MITTIGMEAQPLIRYRTGDHTRIIPGKCICGSEIKRLDFVRRIDQSKSMREMDELLFQIPELVDCCVRSVGETKEITALLHQITEKTDQECLCREEYYFFGLQKSRME